MTMEVSALCINLDSSRDVNGASSRVEQVEREVGRMAAEVRPDVVFTQDKWSAKNLDRLAERMDHNVPGSQFGLEKLVIGGTDHVSIFINMNKFDVSSVEKEKREVIELNQRSNQEFFSENRAVFILASSKQSGYKLLLSSFHAKKNNCTDIKREQLIIQYFKLTEEISKRVKAHGILIGTDINHKMKKFEDRNKKKNFCVKIFHYDYPEGFGRKIEELPVLDYFLHSPSVKPKTAKPSVFNMDLNIFDHHPIHTIFNLDTKGETIPTHLKTGLASKTASIPSEEMTSGWTPKMATILPNRNIVGLSLKPATNSDDNNIRDFSSKAAAIPHNWNKALTSSESKSVSIKGDVTLVNGSNMIGKYQSTLSIEQENYPCSLCPEKTFSTRNGLLIHFGKSSNHHPCKEKINDGENICYEVYNNFVDLERHKAKHNYPCNLCPQSFPTSHGLAIHFGMKHKATHNSVLASPTSARIQETTTVVKEQNTTCGNCNAVFDKRAVPVQCQRCSFYFHKTHFKGHTMLDGSVCD